MHDLDEMRRAENLRKANVKGRFNHQGASNPFDFRFGRDLVEEMNDASVFAASVSLLLVTTPTAYDLDFFA